MHVDHLLPLLVGHLVDHCGADDAGVVHEAVHSAELGNRFGNRTIGHSRVGHAALHCKHARLRQRGDRGVERLTVEVDGHHVGAEFDGQFHNALADALAGPGDDDGAPLQADDGIHFDAPCLLVRWLNQ